METAWPAVTGTSKLKYQVWHHLTGEPLLWDLVFNKVYVDILQEMENNWKLNDTCLLQESLFMLLSNTMLNSNIELSTCVPTRHKSN